MSLCPSSLSSSLWKSGDREVELRSVSQWVQWALGPILSNFPTSRMYNWDRHTQQLAESLHNLASPGLGGSQQDFVVLV